MKFGLSDSALNKIYDVLRSFPAVEEAVIYGSRAMDTYREGSDIDLTLKGDLAYQDLLRIEMELDDKMLPYTFDLSLYHNLENKDLLQHINRAGKILYAKEKTEKNK